VTNTGTDRYSRRRRIATGGMGEVWLAHDEVLNRDVAVKYLKREYADDDGFRTRFLNEARSAAALLHPGIATVFDFGESEVEDGLPYIVMEYVEGRPLSALLADGPLDADRARDLVLQAAEALAVAHAGGLVHRDVKPGNLLVTDDDTVKITDFGIARASDGLALTQTGQLVGTPSYISPEQAEGRSATPASDVYALGVVLFECLTGKRPFEADTPVAIALAHVREPVPELPAEVPTDLAAVTERALAKDPEARYPDAGAFAAAVRTIGAEHTMLLSAPLPTVPAAPPPAGRARAWLPAGRERMLWAAGGALVLLIAIVLAASALNGNGTKDTPGPGASSPTPSASPTKPVRVNVDPAAYLGKPVDEVRSTLRAMGLQTTVDTVPNPGGHAEGTVAALDPAGRVAVGKTITLGVWGPAPKPDDEKDDKSGPGHGKGDDKGKGKN
jgi:serine/threonine protein kinase